jgi:group II intron reverse transcriptase/maturase
MNAPGKSDGRVLPTNPANNGGAEPPAESAEERRPARRNIKHPNLGRTQKPERRRSRGLFGVREAARKSCQLKFTALLHHISEELLTASFYELRKKAAVGVDGVTWHEYEQGLEERIADLHGRIHRGAYRATPSKRVYIDKPDGRKRPLGIASLEDKIVQRAVRTVLECIYEEDFLGFSYGFRPRRSTHHALDALSFAITEKRVNWILDADIVGFFDNIDRDWLVKFLEHRIGDRRIIRLIQKWLKAGVIEGTDWSDSGKGSPQGAVISPLLANVFLHYVFDQWIHQWRGRHARGQCYVVRYADDIVIGFEHEADARACLEALRERLQKFGLTLHPDKTRLIEFGRGSAARREQEGRGRCETFDFLGFTHVCAKTRKTRQFALQRITMAKRMRATLAAIKVQLARRRHDPLGKTGRWLASVLRGWMGYHAVPGNFRRLQQLVQAVTKLWLRQLQRRSQRGCKRWTWERMWRVTRRYLPRPRILHPYPATRFRARLRARAV